MNTAVVRPLLDHLYDPDDVSIGKQTMPTFETILTFHQFGVFW